MHIIKDHFLVISRAPINQQEEHPVEKEHDKLAVHRKRGENELKTRKSA